MLSKQKTNVYRALGLLVICGLLMGMLSGCQKHSHTMETRVIKAADCVNSGTQQDVCSTCDYTEPEKTIEPLGHQYDEGAVILPATCDGNGVKLCTCTVCGTSKTEEIAAAHTWKEEVVREASCYSAGKTRKTCTVCGEIEEVEEKKKSHYFNANSACIYCDSVKMKNIDPNEWYVYTELNTLQFQNAVVADAILRTNGRSVFVTYYAVCASCHIAKNAINAVIPEINNPVMTTYHCDDCGAYTTLQFRIEI